MTRTALTLCLALGLPAVAAADPHGGRHELRNDKGELRDDLRDAERARWFLNELERASAAHDRRALASVEARVTRALEDEAREASRETGEAARELRRDGRKQGWEPAHDYQDERGDRLADDMHRVDDRRDLMREAEYRRRILVIREEWSSLRGLRGRKPMARKHALLEEMVRLSRFEIRRDVQELKEDRRERWEEHHD